tara:strand:+ start:49 stop:219 length:171 start_codon:yes stop_codon:yes gene_type:complete
MSKEISRKEFEELVINYTKNICNDIIKNGFNGIEGWVRELISSEFIIKKIKNIEDE